MMLWYMFFSVAKLWLVCVRTTTYAASQRQHLKIILFRTCADSAYMCVYMPACIYIKQHQTSPHGCVQGIADAIDPWRPCNRDRACIISLLQLIISLLRLITDLPVRVRAGRRWSQERARRHCCLSQGPGKVAAHISVYMSVSVCVCVCVCVCARACTLKCVVVCMYVYVCVCIYIYIYIYIYMHFGYPIDA